MIDDLRHVRAFLAAARIGNFTRAAAELRISQSAFTVQIRQLETALGIALFDRGKRRVALTAAGRDVLGHLERLVVDAEAIVAHTSRLAGLRCGMVSIAVLPSFAARILPDIVHKFALDYPGVAVQIKDVVAEKVIESVKREEADFGIGSHLNSDRGILAAPLFTDRLCAYAPRSHVLAKKDSIALRELVALPLVLTGKGSSVREIFDHTLKREKLVLNAAYETNYMSTAISLVKSGLGIAVLPESAAGPEDLEAIQTISIVRPTLSRKIEILQRKDRTLSPAAGKMLELIQACVKGSKR